jgi:hypothetical protein
MPKVTKVRAAKDYPDKGIRKGEECYVWRVRLQRGGVDCRSKTYPRPSQLNYGFSGQRDAQEPDDLQSFADQLRELGEEQGEKFDNMPEGLQQGDTGQLLEERRDGLESWAGDVESAVQEWQSDLDQLEDDKDEDERKAKEDELRDQYVQQALDASPGL